MEKAVINSTALIMLAKIKRLDLLNVYSKITTQKVKDEILNEKYPENERKYLEEYINTNIKIENPAKEIELSLDPGENSAISLCVEKKVNLFISDDKKARKATKTFLIEVTGTLGLILKNLELKNITKEEAKKLLELLILNSYYLSTDSYLKVMEIIDKF